MDVEGHPEKQTDVLATVNTYCHRCDKEQSHEIYLSSGNYLHSSCSECGKDMPSDAEVAEVAAGITRRCLKEGAPRYHIRYISSGGYTHFFCCTCGKDVSSVATIEKMQRESARPPAERSEEEVPDVQRER